MVYISILFTLFVTRLSTFNKPLSMWKSFIDFMSNKFNQAPYIRPHIVFEMHTVIYLGLLLPSTTWIHNTIWIFCAIAYVYEEVH